MNNIVLVITGPTASGKSGIGIELAKKLNGVVISADSMQIYRGLDIGTAKVTCKEAQGVKHELVDLVDISTNFSVSDYKELCYKKIDEITDFMQTINKYVGKYQLDFNVAIIYGIYLIDNPFL